MVKLKFRNIQGQTQNQTLKRMFPKVENTKGPALDFQVFNGNIGYLTIHSFANEEVVTEFQKLLSRISKTDSLVIDLRVNGGGNSDFAYEILSHFTDESFLTSRWKTPKYLPSYRAWAMWGITDWMDGEEGLWHLEEAKAFQSKLNNWYSKKIVLLISPKTFSAAEDFSVAFKYMRRGRILGAPTGGSTGQPLLFTLPGGGKARVCTKRDTYPDGKDFVGVGVLPDIKVAQSWEDFLERRDVVLERALGLLRKESM